MPKVEVGARDVEGDDGRKRISVVGAGLPKHVHLAAVWGKHTVSEEPQVWVWDVDGWRPSWDGPRGVNDVCSGVGRHLKPSPPVLCRAAGEGVARRGIVDDEAELHAAGEGFQANCGLKRRVQRGLSPGPPAEACWGSPSTPRPRPASNGRALGAMGHWARWRPRRGPCSAPCGTPRTCCRVASGTPRPATLGRCARCVRRVAPGCHGKSHT